MPEVGLQNCVVLGLVEMTKKVNGIEWKSILWIVYTIAVVLVLAFAKIYLSNQIYYESRVVNKMQREISVLQAEREMLQQSVESLKFKHNITNTIFSIEED